MHPKKEKGLLSLPEIEPPITQPTAQSLILTTLSQFPPNQDIS